MNSVETKQSYFRQSRDLLNSVVLVLPLLVVCETMLFTQGTLARNKYDFTYRFIAQMGENGLLIFNTCLIAAAGIAFIILIRRKRLHPAVFPPMLAESLLYGAILGSIVIYVLDFARGLLQVGAAQTDRVVALGLAVGAGVYEEFAFRLVLMGLFCLFLKHVVRWHTAPAVIVAVVFSSALFSLSHFNSLDPADIEINAFLFRFAAGVLLSLIFYFRGFGIAVYTHALYNVLLIIGPTQ